MNKVALVTGATGKIGGAVCLELADAGYDIFVHYHRSKQAALGLIDAIKKIGRSAIALSEDLAKAKTCDKLVESVFKEAGHVDVLVHCASECLRTPFGQVTSDQWDEIMATNLKAAYFLSQSVGIRMKESGRDGNIIHFSDIAAQRPYGDYIPYSVAKAALESMVRGLAVKLAPQVRINAIAPYLVQKAGQLSDQDRDLIERTPLKRRTEPKEIAQLVRFLCEPAATMTGEVLTIDGGRSLTWE